MEITVTREHFNEICTIGTLTCNADPELKLYTLEDMDRHLSQTDSIDQIKTAKVYGQTCIPYGRYELALTFSNKYKRVMPLVVNGPGFEGIRIHSGNKAADTEGCLLVGYEKDILNNQIVQSKAAIAELYQLIDSKSKTEKIFINYVKAKPVL